MQSKILFITSNRLGDAVLSTGLLGWLLEKHHDARVTIVCGPIPSSIFADIPGVEKVIALRKRGWKRHWFDLWQQVRSTKWDVVVDLRNSLVSRLIPARQRLIFTGGVVDAHKVDAIGALVGMQPGPQPRLWFNNNRQEIARRHFSVAAGKPVIVVGPAANWMGKEWPIDRFQALLLRMTAANGPLPDAYVALAAAPDERERAIRVWDNIPENRRIDLIHDMEPVQVAACMAQSDIYIGNDSGLMHIAAAIGIPTVGIFGPSDDRVYGPRGPLTTFVRSPRDAAMLLKEAGDGSIPLTNLMDDISVEAVFDAACQVIGRAEKLRSAS